MGREARCAASWGPRSGQVTVHLDSAELVVRGAFRARAPLPSLRDVRVAADTLHFRTGEDDVALVLGPAAPRWAAAIAKPPPSLAAKLGITAGTRILVEGEIDDDVLAAALAVGLLADGDGTDLIVARIASEHRALLERRIPMWVVYTKGKRAPLGETAVRAMLRERGLMDLKVASVSPALTALQFARTAPR
jgi:hypothetical protein